MAPMGTQSTTRKQAYAMASDLGLSRADRLELAEMLLKTDVTSWRNLTEQQISRITDCLHGWVFVTALLEQRLART